MQQERVTLSCVQKATYLDCIKAISVSGQQRAVLGAEEVAAAPSTWRKGFLRVTRKPVVLLWRRIHPQGSRRDGWEVFSPHFVY